MEKMLCRTIIGPILFLGFSGSALAQDRLTFDILGVSVEAPIPAGYCVPTGKGKVVADLVAAGDPDNITHAVLVRCIGPDSAEVSANDYILFKTPRKSLIAVVTKAQLIAALETEFGKAEWQTGGKATTSSMADTSKGLSEILNTPIEVTGAIVPRGADADCAYLGGEAIVAGAGETYSIQNGSCITSVGNKILTVYTYDDPQASDGVVRLMRKAHDIAVSFTVKPAKTP